MSSELSTNDYWGITGIPSSVHGFSLPITGGLAALGDLNVSMWQGGSLMDGEVGCQMYSMNGNHPRALIATATNTISFASLANAPTLKTFHFSGEDIGSNVSVMAVFYYRTPPSANRYVYWECQDGQEGLWVGSYDGTTISLDPDAVLGTQLTNSLTSFPPQKVA